MPPASANPSRNAVTLAAAYWDSNPLGGSHEHVADPAAILRRRMAKVDLRKDDLLQKPRPVPPHLNPRFSSPAAYDKGLCAPVERWAARTGIRIR
jgi:hypothetical protein